MTAVFCVQATHTDLLSSAYRPGRNATLAWNDPGGYAVGPLLASALRPIVIVAPDLPANRDALPEIARAWEVELVLGDEFNVVRRLLNAASRYEATEVARVVMPSFYLEPTLIGAQLSLLLEARADYCTVPRDFNVGFGADVVTVAALRRFERLVKGWTDDERGFALYRPWPFLERMTDQFDVAVCDDLPDVSAERIAWIRAHPNWPERAGPGVEGGEYRALARDYLRGTDSVLDAGCGHGEITHILSGFAAEVTGVDSDAGMVEIARKRFPACRFETADLHRWTRPGAYDVIFHCHTLEHCADPIAVLRNLGASLRARGRLVVEVPLELRPGLVNPHHEREYRIPELLEQVAAADLEVREQRGVLRGVYGHGTEAREAYLVVCQRAEAPAS
jgi:2-polyprenyl-3-methyl-5-hydroxy-6-metoxy-1,4-benzoquinol methylase